jgi:septum formation protein
MLESRQMPVPPFILASNSPRRRQLLALTGRDFVVHAANIDEQTRPGETPDAYVLRLAAEKARAASQGNTGLVLGSDTTVALGSDIFGKPADPAEARAMLKTLRARSHTVYTAIAIYVPASRQTFSELCATQVPMRDYSDVEIETYIQSGDPLDKAGAYAIQHAEFHPVEHFAGCFASVMGLPLCHLERTLRSLNTPSPLDVPVACQAELSYHCPIYAAVLRGETAD